MAPISNPESHAAQAPALHLHLLGPFYAQLDDQRLGGLRSDKARALLAYLAVEQGHLQARTTLASLFWDEFTSRAAMSSLRVTLSNIKQLLNADHTAGNPIRRNWARRQARRPSISCCPDP